MDCKKLNWLKNVFEQVIDFLTLNYCGRDGFKDFFSSSYLENCLFCLSSRKGQSISISALAKLVLGVIVLSVVVFISHDQIVPLVDEAIAHVRLHEPS